LAIWEAAEGGIERGAFVLATGRGEDGISGREMKWLISFSITNPSIQN
jgi:hypothetical protein